MTTATRQKTDPKRMDYLSTTQLYFLLKSYGGDFGVGKDGKEFLRAPTEDSAGALEAFTAVNLRMDELRAEYGNKRLAKALDARNPTPKPETHIDQIPQPDPRLVQLETREALYTLRQAGAKVTANRQESRPEVVLPPKCTDRKVLAAAALVQDGQHRLPAVDLIVNPPKHELTPELAAVIRRSIAKDAREAPYQQAAEHIRTVQAAGGRVGVSASTNQTDIKLSPGCTDKAVLAAAKWLRENWLQKGGKP